MKTLILCIFTAFYFQGGGHLKAHSEIKKHFTEEELSAFTQLPVEDQRVLNYSVEHAMSELFVPKGKKAEIIKTVERSDYKNAKSYLDLGIRLKENKTQFFKLNDGYEFFKVKSMSHLRIEMNTKKNIK